MTSNRVLAFVVLVGATAAAGLSAQRGGGPPQRDQAMAPTTGTAAIVGTVVVNEAGGEPLRRVAVSLVSRQGAGLNQRQTTTDDQGRFTFLNLPAGTYSPPRATKPGYVPSNYGEKRPDSVGTPITLVDGQKLTIGFKLLRAGVITGTVLLDGRPLTQTSVSATPVRLINGVRTSGLTRGGTFQTDDRGIYRIYGLAPGDYVVAVTPRLSVQGEVRQITEAEIRWAERQLETPASTAGIGPASVAPPPAQPIGYSPVYYPGTNLAANAATISIAAGQERSGVDISVVHVPTARIEGTLVDPDDRPVQTAQMNLVPMLDEQAFLTESSMILDAMMLLRPTVASGKFSMAGVRPGRYILSARAAPTSSPQPATGRGAPPPAMTMWANAELTVNGVDQTDIALRLQPGMTLSGRVAFEATTLQPPADLARITVRLMAAPTAGATVSVNAPNAIIQPDGTFKLEGVSPGRYLLSSFVPGANPGSGPSWILKSARVGSVDAADTGFEVKPGESMADIVIAFSDRPAELSGTLLDTTGKPTSALSIILFPTDRTMWSQRSRRMRAPVRAGTDGKFRFTGLLAGEYFLAALSDYEQADIYKQEFLEQIAAAAMKLTIAEGEKKVQDLKIAGASGAHLTHPTHPKHPKLLR